MTDYSSAWAAYQEAVSGLYDRAPTAMATRGGGEIAAADDLPDRAQIVLERSLAFGEVTARGMASPDVDQRELAGLQLLSAAAIDLALATDLMRAEKTSAPAEVVQRGSVLPSAMTELYEVMSLPPEAGIRALLAKDLGAVRASAPTEPAAAQQALRDSVEVALTSIRDGAAAAGQALFVGLTSLPLPPIQSAASAAIQEILTRLDSQISLLVRRAASLVVEALHKVLQALGKDAESEARRQAARWIEDLQKGTILGTLLDKLYEPDKIRADIEQLIEQAGSDVAALNSAGQRVLELRVKFGKQKDILIWIARGLAWARPWLIGMQPWGPLTVTAAYVASLGYTVYGGGDYVDWFRTGSQERLNFVPGVRTVVRSALAGGG